MSIDFWCELASPYTYLAACRIDVVAADASVAVRWRPFVLHPIFKANGWATSPFEIYKDKGRYMWRDMEREADRLAIPFRRPSVFPRNSVPAAKAALVGVDRPWGVPFVQRVLTANFVEDRDIASREVIVSIFEELGVDGREILEESTSATYAQSLRRATEDAMALRIFGAPTFVVRGELFWGNDRLEQAIDWALTARATSIPPASMR